MELTLGSIFPLTQADLAAPKPPVDAGVPQLKRIRAVHHQAARLIATGASGAEISLATGLCESRISILKSDPSFQQLISHYAAIDEEAFIDVRKKVADLGVTAAEVLQDRLLESPEDVSTKDLIGVLTSALDRGGFAPVQKSVAVTTTFSPDDVEAIKTALGQAPVRERRTFDGEAVKETSGVSEDQGSGMGAAVAGAEPPAETPEGLSGTGAGI